MLSMLQGALDEVTSSLQRISGLPASQAGAADMQLFGRLSMRGPSTLALTASASGPLTPFQRLR